MFTCSTRQLLAWQLELLAHASFVQERGTFRVQ